MPHAAIHDRVSTLADAMTIDAEDASFCHTTVEAAERRDTDQDRVAGSP
jgi:hypothetical protein